MLTSFHSKVTVSVGDCLDEGGIFRRETDKHLKQGGWKCVVSSPRLVGASSQGSTVNHSSRVVRLAI